MTKFSDTQAILLSTASQRDDNSVLPLPAGIKPGGGASKALATLMKSALIEERETVDAGCVHRTDGDLSYGLFLTPAGTDAIGVEPSGAAAAADSDNRAPAHRSDEATPKRRTKAAAVLALLTREDGATMPELIEATGWLPHTTRAALTGLRKKGHDIARTKRDSATCYRIVEPA